MEQSRLWDRILAHVTGAIFLLPFTVYGLLKNREFILKHWKLFLLMGALFVPLGNGLIYVSYLYTTAINGGVVSASQPALTVLLSWLLFNEFINWKQSIGILLTGVGVLSIITNGELSTLAGGQFNIGFSDASRSNFGAHITYLFARYKGNPISQLLIIVLCTGSLITLPLYILETIYIAPVTITPLNIFSIIWVGVAVTTIAVGMISFSIRKIGANKASISNYMRALFTALLAVLILDENFEFYHMFAIIFVISGVFLMTLGTAAKNDNRVKQQ